MKIKQLLLALGIMTALPVAVHALNPKDQDVRFTVHNLAYNTDQNQGLTNDYTQRTWFAQNPGANQVCVFCHTPHNATRNAPLWNRVADTGVVYRLYTSSSTGLSPAAKSASITSANESMLCLSCHDGKTAVNVMHNSSYRDNAPGGDAIIDVGNGNIATSMGDLSVVGFGYPSNLGALRDSQGRIAAGGKSVGYNLTDDHPIGFSYDAARSNKPTEYKDRVTQVDPALRFYGPAKNRIECSTCHDPHMFYGYIRSGGSRVSIDSVAPGITSTQAQKDRTPFLVRDNNGSAMCLGCHIK